jgi:hypothetical protein
MSARGRTHANGKRRMYIDIDRKGGREGEMEEDGVKG